MLANFLIGLREGLEAGLVVGILVAYLRKVGRTDLLPRMWAGIAAAIALSLGVGALLTWGPYSMSDEAQEALAGGLSILAVALVTWMVLWMARSARELRGTLHGRLDTAIAGAGLGIVLLGFVTVGREGVETALFVWASVAATGSAAQGTIGAFLGILAALALSYLIFRGFVRINLSRFFLWTGLFLIVIAAGVLSYGIHELQEVGVVPGPEDAAYSLAALIPAASWLGALLAGVFNFTPEPSWQQVIAWVAYVAIVTPVFLRLARPKGVTPAGTPADLPVASAGAAAETSAVGARV